MENGDKGNSVLYYFKVIVLEAEAAALQKILPHAYEVAPIPNETLRFIQ